MGFWDLGFGVLGFRVWGLAFRASCCGLVGEAMSTRRPDTPTGVGGGISCDGTSLVPNEARIRVLVILPTPAYAGIDPSLFLLRILKELGGLKRRGTLRLGYIKLCFY